MGRGPGEGKQYRHGVGGMGDGRVQLGQKAHEQGGPGLG